MKKETNVGVVINRAEGQKEAAEVFERVNKVSKKFLDFNIDKEFANCVDSFILVDIAKIKEAKKARYIKGH